MFKCICLILRSRLTVTISSGNNISLHDICIVCWPNDAPISHHLMFCLMSALLSCCVCVSLRLAITCIFYILHLYHNLSSQSHCGCFWPQQTFLSLSRHMRRDSPDRRTEGITAMYLHSIRDPWSGHIHILLRSLH